jgi:transposase
MKERSHCGHVGSAMLRIAQRTIPRSYHHSLPYIQQLFPMGFCHISTNNLETGIRLCECGRDTDEEIKQVCQFSIRTLQRAHKRLRETRTAAHAPAVGRGWPRSYVAKDAEYLLNLARHKPTRFLDEYCNWLDQNRHLPLSVTTVHRIFKRGGLRVKQVQKIAAERNPMH